MATRPPVLKMTTLIPNQITTPDEVDTPIGKLDFFDGVPPKETVDTIFDYVDRARAVEVFIKMIPAVSMFNIRKGQRALGLTACNQVLIWEQLADSKSFVLTFNTSTLYAWCFLDLKKDGPIVVDVPPGMLDDMCVRCHGPLNAFNDKTWVPNDVEAVG